MLENYFQTILNTVKSWLPQDFRFSDLLPQNWLPPELLPENWLPPDFRFQDLLTREYLPVLLLAFGVLLLIFCLIWIIAQRRAAKRRAASKTRKKRKGRAAAPAALQQEQVDDERFRRLEEIIQVQKQQISSMELQLDKAAKQRHDFRKELLILQEFARNGDREALERYLPQVSLDSAAITIPVCSNPLVNAMLQFYFNKANASGITVDAAVEADETLWLTAGDVGVIFGNLLENAVTAAAEAPAGNRRIRLRTKQTADCFVIALGNTFGSPRSYDAGGAFASTKPDHNGIGLGSIRATALQYDGEAKFLVDGDMFMSYVILLRPNNT